MSKVQECIEDLEALTEHLDDVYDKYKILEVEFSILKIQKEQSLRLKNSTSFSISKEKTLPSHVSAKDVEYELTCDPRYREYLELKIEIDRLKDKIRVYEMKSRLLARRGS